MGRGHFGERAPINVKYKDFLSLQKQLNQSICRLVCGHKRAEGSTSTLAPPANTIELSVCGSDVALSQTTYNHLLPLLGRIAVLRT